MKISKYELVMEKTAEYNYDKNVRCADDIVDFAVNVIKINKKDREHFLMVCVNSKLDIIAVSDEGIGDLTSAPVSIREIAKTAILANAAGVFFVHNHPSEDVTPSDEDIDTTKRLMKSFEILGIKVIDHVIVGGNDFTSMRSEGCLEE